MNNQIGNKINDKTYIPLPPFKGWVLENFPFIEDDFDCLTNYQMLCLMFKKLNEVISNQNQVQDLGSELVVLYNALVDAVNSAISEFETEVTADINQFKIDTNTEISNFETFITGKFNELKDYVDNFFDNNFPEMVSDKLDEMASDGTLENLLNDTAHLIKVYNTYTDMIADSTTFTNGLRLKTLGYSSINDGGAAEYYVNNSVIATNYQIELSNSLYLNLISDTINVKKFGAYGDGTHDDYNAISNAINYAKTSNKNNVYFPIGNYLINTNIVIDDAICLIGEYSQSQISNTERDTKGTTLICGYTGNEPFIKYELSNEGTISRLFGVKISNLLIDGNNKNNIGLYLHAIGWDGLIDSVRIRNFNNTGLYLDKVYDSEFNNLSIINCGSKNSSGSINYALVLTDSENDTTNACKFIACHFEHNRYALNIIKGRNNQFIACKWENEKNENESDSTNPEISFDTKCLETNFSNCMFVPISYDAWNNSSISNPPCMIIFKNITNTMSFVNFDSCQFTTAGQNGGHFINCGSGKCNISNCNFTSLAPVGYALNLTRVSVSNCFFNIQNNLNSITTCCPIYLEACQVDNCYFNYVDNAGTLTTKNAFYLNSNNIVSKCRYNSVKPILSYNSTNNQIEYNNYLKMTNSNYLSNMDLTTDTVNWSSLVIDRTKIFYSNFYTQFDQDVVINQITGGQNGDVIMITNQGTHNVSLGGVFGSDGTRIKGEGSNQTALTTLETYGSVILMKNQNYWKIVAVN